MLNATTAAAVDDDNADDDEDEAEDTTTKTPTRTFNNASSNKPQSRVASPFNDVPITNYQSSYTFAYLWMTRMMRSTLGWIGFASLILLILNAFVFGLWFFNLIPTISYSFLHYGVIWYIYFFFTGLTTLVISFSVDKALHTISFFLVVAGFFLSIGLLAIIFFQAYECWTGQLASQCADFYLTQFVLFGNTALIAIVMLALVILFTVVLMRIKNSFSSIDPQALI